MTPTFSPLAPLKKTQPSKNIIAFCEGTPSECLPAPRPVKCNTTADVGIIYTELEIKHALEATELEDFWNQRRTLFPKDSSFQKLIAEQYNWTRVAMTTEHEKEWVVTTGKSSPFAKMNPSTKRTRSHDEEDQVTDTKKSCSGGLDWHGMGGKGDEDVEMVL